jgi:Fe-S-cluster-containing dehydrogenase component/DMSO reductase anchor subunit
MKGFVFDINKCVACHACVVACSVENDIIPPIERRSVYTFNEIKHPDLPAFNLSLACNHCEDASCMDACPAGAYTRDLQTGAVILNNDICMACGYCTWACPYDAPQLNRNTGLIDKCTLCNEKIKDGGKPACALNCPTGALSYDEFEDKDLPDNADGFPESNNRPGIRFVPKRSSEKLEIIPKPVTGGLTMLNKEDIPVPDSKISLQKEWPLLLFTLIVPVLTGLVSGFVTDLVFMKEWLYILIAGMALLLSTLHLGRKDRAFYAIRNLRKSWLSREILTYGMFFLTSVLYLILDSGYVWLGILSVISGLLCTFSMDKVYSYFQLKSPSVSNSSSAFLSALMWISLAQQEIGPLGFIVGIKVALYIRRKTFYDRNRLSSFLISVLRLSFLVIIPALFHIYTNLGIWYLFFPLFAGEVIDRMEFFTLAYIDSPARRLYNLFLNKIRDKNAKIA